MTPALILMAPAGLAVIVGLGRLMLTVVTVSGDSMSPALRDGDRVVVRRRWPGPSLRPGNIVTVAPPGAAGGGLPALFVKRVGLVERDLVHVHGDAAHSVDSALFGPVPLRDVHGVLVAVLPRGARGRERRGRGNPMVGQVPPPLAGVTLDDRRLGLGAAGSRLLVFVSPGEQEPEWLREKVARAAQAGPAGLDVLWVSDGDAAATRDRLGALGGPGQIVVAPREDSPVFSAYQVPRTPYFCLVEHGLVTAAGFVGVPGGAWEGLLRRWGATAAG